MITVFHIWPGSILEAFQVKPKVFAVSNIIVMSDDRFCCSDAR
jgi:hypothetical protein